MDKNAKPALAWHCTPKFQTQGSKHDYFSCTYAFVLDVLLEETMQSVNYAVDFD
jgi:hypothetical protein